MSRYRCIVAGRTDPGRVRENNEDSLAMDQDLPLYVVADGMGGHNSGEVASHLATETILDFARRMMGQGSDLAPRDALKGGEPRPSSIRARQLEYCVQSANTVIYEKAKAFPQDHGMGTTVVAVSVDGDSLAVAHVGDSRFYILRGGILQVMTQDHSLVADQLRRGLITAEEAERSTMQNILTRALGTEPMVQVDIQEHPMLPGDVFLLCTDGLTKMVPEAEIEKVLLEGGPPPVLCDRLVEKAKEAGGVDNITVLVGKVGPQEAGVKGFLRRLFGDPGATGS